MPRLPLTPVERYFFHDHRESHPAWIRYEFTFRGTLERAAFARAWGRIEERHPLTGATVSRRTWGGPVWNLGAVRPEWVWLDTAAPETDGAAVDLHDLSKRAGLRGFAWVQGAETHLTLLVHHAVADGLGLLLIAEDLFALYAIGCGAEIGLPAATAGRRGSEPLPLAHWPWVLLGVVWGMVLGRQRVVELRSRGAAGRRERTSRTAPAGVTARMRDAARAAGASLNELLIRDVQAALGAWLERHGAARPEEWTRLLVPVNTGGNRRDAGNSANALGVAPIDRRVKSLGRRARLLQRAREDMAFVRRRGLARAFGAAMWLRGWWPGWIARHCRRGGARSTLVFSNLGRVFSQGPLVQTDGRMALPGAELVSFVGWGPCRPGTAVFILAAEYRGALAWGVSFDSEALGAAQAADFADALDREFLCSAAGE